MPVVCQVSEITHFSGQLLVILLLNFDGVSYFLPRNFYPFSFHFSPASTLVNEKPLYEVIEI